MKGVQSGPYIVSGNLNPVQVMDPNIGPSLAYLSGHLLDTRQVGGIEASLGVPGYKAYGLWTNPYITVVDAKPQTLSTTLIAAAAATVANTPMTLASTDAAGRTMNLPLIPLGSSYASGNKVTPSICLDAGFTSGNTTGSAAQITNIPAGEARFFKKGQRIWIAGGLSAGQPFFTTVSATPALAATSVSTADVIPTSVTGGRIGSADPWSINAGWAYQMYGPASDVAIADPAQMIGRAVSITGNAGSTAQNFTVVGYDAWGQPQTEVIAFAGGAVTTNGKKAFKWITSVTPGTTDAGHTLSCGTTDIFGINMRDQLFEYVNIFWAGAFITASTGWVAADDTDPATTSTGDTRGTYAVQSASDGSKRLAIFLNIPVMNALLSDNLTNKSLFGVTPV